MVINISTPNVYALSISSGLLLIYHLIYLFQIHVTHKKTIQINSNTSNVLLWVAKHMEAKDAQNTVLAVQTLRNMIMAAVFVGGFSLNASYGVLQSISDNDVVDTATVKNVILGACLFGSFLCWTQVIRNAVHLGFIISGWYGQLSLKDKPQQEITEAYKLQSYVDCCLRAERLVLSFSYGFRFLYMSIPFAFAALGPIALLLVTGIILVCECIWDYGDYIHSLSWKEVCSFSSAASANTSGIAMNNTTACGASLALPDIEKGKV